MQKLFIKEISDLFGCQLFPVKSQEAHLLFEINLLQGYISDGSEMKLLRHFIKDQITPCSIKV